MVKIKTIVIRAVFTLVLLSTRASGESPVKIGIIAPLSGEVATWGNDVRNVLLFAKRKMHLENIEFVFEDDQCLGKNAVSSAQKLISVDKVNFAFIVCTESTMSVAPIFERAKLLVISPAAGGADVSNAGDYIFRTWPSSATTGQLLFDYVKSRHRVFAVLSEERGYPQELAASFLLAARDGQLKVVSEAFRSEETDYRAIIKRLEARGVDGIFVNTNAERAFASILSQLRQLNWKAPIYGVYMPGYSSFLKLAGELANGIIYVAAPSAETSLTEEGKKLYSEFVSEYGELRSSSFVFASTFEALARIAGLKPGKEEPREQLYHGHFNGVFGEYTFDANGDIVGVQHKINIIRGGVASNL